MGNCNKKPDQDQPPVERIDPPYNNGGYNDYPANTSAQQEDLRRRREEEYKREHLRQEEQRRRDDEKAAEEHRRRMQAIQDQQEQNRLAAQNTLQQIQQGHKFKMAQIQDASGQRQAHLDAEFHMSNASMQEEHIAALRAQEEQERRDRDAFESRRVADELSARNLKTEHDADMQRRSVQLAREEDEHRRLMRDMQEKSRAAREQTRREFERRRQQANAQIRLLAQMLAQKQWNDTVESRWGNRLTFLRSAYRPVAVALGDFFSQTVYQEEKMRCSKEFDPVEHGAAVSCAKSLLENVRAALYEQMSTLENEATEMRHLQSTHGAPFLRDIEQSVLLVLEKCRKLSNEIDAFARQLGQNNWDTRNLNRAAEEVHAASMAIPCVPDLKRKYSQWHHDQNQQHHQQQSYDQYSSSVSDQSVVITEID